MAEHPAPSLRAVSAPADPTGARFLINGIPDGRIDPRDRGFCLGDGLFETMAVRRGRIRFHERHMERLARGCETLMLPVPERALLESELAQLIGAGEDGTLRLTWTRGPGPRGYAPPAEAAPTRVLAFHPGRPAPPERPARLRWCETRLGVQPRLAGLKHLNRLEQVLARAEWNDPCIDEGIMRAVDGRVIECTMANLFLARGDRLITPDLGDCGVAGVVRAVALDAAAEAGMEARTRDVTPADVAAADEIFITSAARGISPVGRIDDRAYPAPGPVTQSLDSRIDWMEHG